MKHDKGNEKKDKVANIMKIRDLYGYSQEYVAMKMGISQNAYHKIENEITAISVKHLRQLSEIFEVPVTELLGDYLNINKVFLIAVESVTKETIVASLEEIKLKVLAKRYNKHIFYPQVSILLSAVNQTIDNVYND